jgi:hypothetical protein
VVDFRNHFAVFGGVFEGSIAGIGGLAPQEVAKATRILPPVFGKQSKVLQ